MDKLLRAVNTALLSAILCVLILIWQRQPSPGPTVGELSSSDNPKAVRMRVPLVRAAIDDETPVKVEISNVLPLEVRIEP